VFIAQVVDRRRLAVLTSRYSTLALFAFIGVAASGVVSAWLRVGSLAQLFETGYGQLVLIKTAALVVLGIFGAVQRTRLIPRIAAARERAFLWFVLAELAVMGVASGIAGALGRTATPVALEPLRDQGGSISPAEWLTGDPLPPELTVERYFTEWRFDLAWVLVCAFGAVLYLGGVIRLARRGDRWPIGRTIAWLVGLALLFYSTNGALNAYEQYLFSMHMLAHMMLAMLIPLVLVLGAPVTLALRATEKRDDGSWGGREWILWAVQTPYSKVITHPAVAAVIFVGSLWIFYFTPIARWAASEHLGHQWMIIHFLIGGYLFSLSMVGIDPVPYRFPYPLRLVTLFATMASHAFFGVTVMTGDGLLMADWYGAMGREWGATPLEDQRIGGGIAWGIGELPTLALALVVAVQWSRSDTKEQKRKDRYAERSGEAELEAYNQMLAKQAERDARQAGKR
ncbi:MAG: bifunctional copper resistance protein CopD/cytochrome c oxidase assembly protein, partial [Leucobacter sp.]